MSIEKSVFDQDKMQTFLLLEYDLHMISSRLIPFGSANCYRVNCMEGTYFFKEYQKEFTIQDVKKETELVEYLFSEGFPVARPIRTKSGNRCTLYKVML